MQKEKYYTTGELGKFKDEYKNRKEEVFSLTKMQSSLGILLTHCMKNN